MKIAFRFENGTSQVILSPETAREKQYISLCSDGRNSVRVKPTAHESLVIEFAEERSSSESISTIEKGESHA